MESQILCAFLGTNHRQYEINFTADTITNSSADRIKFTFRILYIQKLLRLMNNIINIPNCIRGIRTKYEHELFGDSFYQNKINLLNRHFYHIFYFISNTFPPNPILKSPFLIYKNYRNRSNKSHIYHTRSMFLAYSNTQKMAIFLFLFYFFFS